MTNVEERVAAGILRNHLLHALALRLPEDHLPATQRKLNRPATVDSLTQATVSLQRSGLLWKQ
ncbi:MAG: hypothetical protein OXS30_07555 [Chloroflexota bacterium]|nr:hypothetical protein [Chloroflexota bacterium]